MKFTELVGLDTVKQALLLLAVDPRLGGCIMSASIGSGKSTLARAFRGLLPEGTPFVEMPVNTSEDRLIGGIDLEATLAGGRRVLQRGLLAQAHGGVLHVDGINLLDAAIETALIATLANGDVRVERDGLSARFPAQFMLLGTFDPREGELRKGLLDRVALIAPFTMMADANARAEVVRRNQALTANEDAATELALLCAVIADARATLPGVTISQKQIETLVKLALSLGVEGNRADVFAARAAVANAALNGRDGVDDDDLQLAAKLVLLPRATQLPEQQQPEEQRAPEPPPAEQQQPESNEDAAQPPETAAVPEEMLFAAIAADLPADVLALPFAAARNARSGSRGEALNLQRGKFVRAVPGAPRDGRIAVLHTLLAAAPWQHARQAAAGAGKRAGVRLETADIRLKRYRDKAGTLFVFIVDASGSMALNRMREAKGAAAKLLQTAYVHRDQVALVAFRGRGAQVLLPPSTSVDRAKRELDVLRTGGATPLASALLTGWQLVKQARGRGVRQASLVLMTDGRGNCGLNPDVPADRETLKREIDQLALLVRGDGVASVVIDTQASYASRGEAAKLAQQLGGRYVYLPNARAEQIAALVAGVGVTA